MKAEQRKELKSNVLVDQARRVYHNIQHRPRSTTVLFWALVLLAVGLTIGWYVAYNSTLKARSALWLQVSEDATTDPSKLDELAKAHPGTDPAIAARFLRARQQLREGLDKLCSDEEKERTEAHKNVEEAAAAYEQLARETKSWLGRPDGTALLAQEALLGAGTAKETLGDLEAATDYYKRLKESKPESFLTHKGIARLARLEEDPTKTEVANFYEQFDQMNKAAKP